ncbi:hypothetical protein TNCV_4466881 [Trichonephila clavipes]|nr:hypothetical protein TNCV_4466881 [Trichonephila clavipes]
MIVQFRNEKVINHGSIPITIDCNVVAFVRNRCLHLATVYLQADDHVHPGNCPAAVSSEKKTRPSPYVVLPSPAELGYERTDAVFFFSF